MSFNVVLLREALVRTDPDNGAFLLVGLQAPQVAEKSSLRPLIEWFEDMHWPVAFVAEAGAATSYTSRPKPGDLIVRSHGASLAREAHFLGLYHDFGEPRLVIAGTWDRDLLIGTTVDCYLSGFAVGIAQDACESVRMPSQTSSVAALWDLLSGFSYALSVDQLKRKEAIWRF
jgi:hypothetical protein